MKPVHERNQECLPPKKRDLPVNHNSNNTSTHNNNSSSISGSIGSAGGGGEDAPSSQSSGASGESSGEWVRAQPSVHYGVEGAEGLVGLPMDQYSMLYKVALPAGTYSPTNLHPVLSHISPAYTVPSSVLQHTSVPYPPLCYAQILTPRCSLLALPTGLRFPTPCPRDSFPALWYHLSPLFPSSTPFPTWFRIRQSFRKELPLRSSRSRPMHTPRWEFLWCSLLSKRRHKCHSGLLGCCLPGSSARELCTSTPPLGVSNRKETCTAAPWSRRERWMEGTESTEAGRAIKMQFIWPEAHGCCRPLRLSPSKTRAWKAAGRRAECRQDRAAHRTLISRWGKDGLLS